jgi:hypothetical protein
MDWDYELDKNKGPSNISSFSLQSLAFGFFKLIHLRYLILEFISIKL